MTLSEFKAWFEGFTEDMESAPTPKQWKRIKARVAQIDGVAVTREVVYRDRWLRDYWSMPLSNELRPLRAFYGAGTNAAQAVGASGAGCNLTAAGKAEYSASLS